MTVDKVTLSLATGALTPDKTANAATDAKSARKTDKTDVSSDQAATSTDTTDSCEFSTQAKDLQETEKVLRFALEKLESFDEVRQDQLGDIKDKVDQDFYFDDSVTETVSERMFSNQDIAQIANQHLEVKQYLNSLSEMDQQDSVDSDKVASIKEKVSQGYYNDPDVIAGTADKLLEIIG